MTEVINKYEAIIIIQNTLEEEAINGLVEKFKSLIESEGTIESLDLWGKRRLSYPINDLNEGYYVFVQFSCKPTFPQELERVLKITDGIMRYMIIKQTK